MNECKYLWDEPINSLQKNLIEKSRDLDDLKIEMSEFDSSFLCGMLRLKKPVKILELGVSAGGTSCLLLSTLEMLNYDYQLFSVDINERYYRDNRYESGYLVNEFFPELGKKQTIYRGNVICAYLDMIGKDIDFCIIDTAHRVPGELLDFLSVLPYLKRNATIILHDIALHLLIKNCPFCYATALLYSSVVGEKIYIFNRANPEQMPNIGAFIINSDTYKYIENVFYALRMPCHYIPDEKTMNVFCNFFEKYYSRYLCNIFKQSDNLNASILKNNFKFKLDDYSTDGKFCETMIT